MSGLDLVLPLACLLLLAWQGRQHAKALHEVLSWQHAENQQLLTLAVDDPVRMRESIQLRGESMDSFQVIDDDELDDLDEHLISEFMAQQLRDAGALFDEDDE